MSWIENVIGSDESTAIKIRLWAAALTLLLATPPIAANAARQVQANTSEKGAAMSSHTRKITKKQGYARVNGLKMYYEIEGTGAPLVFVPPAFGFAGQQSFSELLQNHTVITVDLRGNGRTADIPDRPISIEQYATDVVELLRYLKIAKADFLGESYGGDTVAFIAVHNPEMVRRVATYSATFAPPPYTLNPEVTHYDEPPTAETRDIQFQRESYKRAAPEPDYWPTIYDKVSRIHWKGFSKKELASIKAPFLIMQGDHDFVRLEHSVSTAKLIPRAELAVIPDGSHFALCSEPDRVIPIVKYFLDQPEKRLPLATASTGYHPGETR